MKNELTVKELLEKLSKLDPNEEVFIDFDDMIDEDNSIFGLTLNVGNEKLMLNEVQIWGH